MSFWIAGTIIVGSVATAGTAAYNAKKQRKQTRKQAEAFVAREDAAAAKLEADTKRDKERTAMTLAMRGQRRRSRSGERKRNDIKTGSLGVMNAAATASKQLLGQ